MAKHQLKGLFYNCDEKYFSGHKCKEKNIFISISKDVDEEDINVSHSKYKPQVYDHTQPSDPLYVELLISLNALIGISTP
jgi:hypothetical protein